MIVGSYVWWVGDPYVTYLIEEAWVVPRPQLLVKHPGRNMVFRLRHLDGKREGVAREGECCCV